MADWTEIVGEDLEELLVCSEVRTDRNRLEDHAPAKLAADANPCATRARDLREALVGNATGQNVGDHEIEQ